MDLSRLGKTESAFLPRARAAGFEAYGCWVSDRREYFFVQQSMQADKLNANVVLVKVNGKDVYFDPGAAFTPFGLLTWSETSTPGLRLDKDGGTWITTTLPKSSESRVERKASFKLDDSTGDLEGKVTITYGEEFTVPAQAGTLTPAQVRSFAASRSRSPGWRRRYSARSATPWTCSAR